MTSLPGIEDARRVVLLGASNVALCWLPLVRTVFERLRGPLHVMTAHGMGRSYIASSQFGWRSAPGILDCGLWSELAEHDRPPPDAALIADLGNDLVYGRTAAAVVQAAADTAGRLREASPDCRIVVTRPPLDSVESLSKLRYRVFRTVLFPLCRLSLSQIVDATRQLDDGIQKLDDVTVVSQQAEWFGLDPIHFRRQFRESAFAAFLHSWPKDPEEATCSDPAPFNRPTMAIRSVLGRKRVCEQPSVVTLRGVVSAW